MHYVNGSDEYVVIWCIINACVRTWCNVKSKDRHCVHLFNNIHMLRVLIWRAVGVVCIINVCEDA